MSAEMILAGAAVSGVIVTAAITGIGLRVTWRRNGKEQRTRDIAQAEVQAARDQELKSNQDAILRRLDDDRTGLAALSEKQNNMTNHCTEVSIGFAGRIITTERDIKELKTQK